MADSNFDDVLGFLQVLWQLNHALEVRSKRMRTALGVTGPQRFLLRLIGESPYITAGALAAVVRVHPSTVSGMLRRLVEAELVAISVDASDRRRALCSLTSRGKRVHADRAGTVEEAVAEVIADLAPAEVATARSMLERVAQALQSPTPKGSKKRASETTVRRRGRSANKRA